MGTAVVQLLGDLRAAHALQVTVAQGRPLQGGGKGLEMGHQLLPQVFEVSLDFRLLKGNGIAFQQGPFMAAVPIVARLAQRKR